MTRVNEIAGILDALNRLYPDAGYLFMIVPADGSTNPVLTNMADATLIKVLEDFVDLLRAQASG